VVADFNGDNRADFATANVGDAAGVSGPNQDTVSIRLGVGDGTFITPTVPEVLACGNPERLVMGHVNADEHLDLVVACLRTEEVAVLLGDGLGGFTHASASPLATGPAREVAIANVGGSAALDLVITQETRGTLAVWLGAGDGSFAFASEAAVDDVTYSVTLADFNGDMRVDAAATTLHGAVLLLGNGDGSFRRPERWRLGAPGNEIASADLDGDGVPEIVLVGQGRATTLQSAF
jgi:hypothetical protein